MSSAPTDCRVPDPTDAKADGGFGNHRAGYSRDRLAQAEHWARKGGTLAAGEGLVLVQEIDRLRTRLAAAERQLEVERMRLAACGVAALGYFEGCADEYRSASLDDVLRLHARLAALTSHMNEVHEVLGGTDTVLTLEAALHVVAKLKAAERVVREWQLLPLSPSSPYAT